MSDRAELIRNALAFLTDPNVTLRLSFGTRAQPNAQFTVFRRETTLSRSVSRFSNQKD